MKDCPICGMSVDPFESDYIDVKRRKSYPIYEYEEPSSFSGDAVVSNLSHVETKLVGRIHASCIAALDRRVQEFEL